MEAKLREYRAARRRKEIISNAKETISNAKETIVESTQKISSLFIPKFISKMSMEKEEEALLMENEEIPYEEEPRRILQHLPTEPEPIDEEIASEVSELESITEDKPWFSKYTIAKWVFGALAWCVAYAYFLKLQFGAVFFVMSVLVGIYFNTRTRPRKKGEVSAYSVFNENCVSIDGTLKAEQFEREIRYGAGSVR